jgi:DNA-binding NarL/FixJ family response regulator
MSKIRVLVADDHEIVRFGICSVIDSSEDLTVIGESKTGNETVESYRKLKPDVVLLDVSMPEKNGIEITSEILKIDSNARILILTMHLNEEYLNQALNAGALGYLLKNSDITELLDGVRKVAGGKQVFSAQISSIMTDRYVKRAQYGKKDNITESPRLTRREKEILEQITEGKTSQEIADQLFISPRTVDTHRANLIQKLGVKNVTGLVRYAIEKELLK